MSFRELVRIMLDADLEAMGEVAPGEGMALLPARFNGWHRWEGARVYA